MKISFRQSIPERPEQPDISRLSGVETRPGRFNGRAVVTFGRQSAGLMGLYVCDDTPENRRVIEEAGSTVLPVFGG